MMKTIYMLIPFILTITLFSQDPPLHVVDDVDLEKYAGTWYEIARLPNRFQEKCVGDVSATYSLIDKGQIEVVNRCRLETGEFTETVGRARRAGKNEPVSKLKVRFAPRILSWLPFVWGNYWIIDLDPGYRYAVVGDPSRKYLWILSREPEIDETTFEQILGRIKQQQYDITKLIKTNHTTK